jgi:UDP-N-acetyl-D-galactosamine dehydrogenase
MGYIPQVILAGRRINDGMGRFVAQQTVKKLISMGHHVKGATVTVLGLTFKEDCPDLRNSKVADIIRELREYGVKIQVADPKADPVEAEREYGVSLTPLKKLRKAVAVIIAVAHKEYRKIPLKTLAKLMGRRPVLIDVKGIIERADAQKAGIGLWRL